MKKIVEMAHQLIEEHVGEHSIAAVSYTHLWTMAKEVASQPQKIYIAVMLIAFFANVVLHLSLIHI